MARLRQFLSPQARLDATHIQLDRAESHHLVAVRRARPGEPVEVFAGDGREWTTELEETDRAAARLRIREARQQPPLRPAVTLVCALIQGKPWEWLLQKATELQATRIIPLLSARCGIRLDERHIATKALKWRTLLIEACKQSGNGFLPELESPRTFDALLGDLRAAAIGGSLALAASLESGARPLRTIAEDSSTNGLPGEIWCLIGPEGDFSPEEYHALQALPAQPFRLGPAILRTETAALAALVQIRYAFNPHLADDLYRAL